MISDAYAAKELARLRSLSGGRSITPAQIAEWTRIARATARNDAQLKGAITAWLDTQTFPPSPAELRTIIEATPTHASSRGNCEMCGGGGRRSFWALITTERWEDSGRIRRRTCEEIPCTGDPNFWLMHEPELAARVDGNRQRVALLSGYCGCSIGHALRRDQSALMRCE